MKRTTIHFIFGSIAACLLLVTSWQGYKLYKNQRVRSAVSAVPETMTEHDPDVTNKSHPAVMLKTAIALSAGGEFDAAEALYVRLGDQQQDSTIGVASRYNLANHYLRQGLRPELPGAQTRPLIEIAKQRYRDLLLAKPDHWDARVNLEHALRAAPEISDKLFDKRPPVKSVNVVVPDFTLKDLP
ncbi:MAG: hypothetical protein V3U65_07905 [Granulosicoccaceae bacterium]